MGDNPATAACRRKAVVRRHLENVADGGRPSAGPIEERVTSQPARFDEAGRLLGRRLPDWTGVADEASGLLVAHGVYDAHVPLDAIVRSQSLRRSTTCRSSASPSSSCVTSNPDAGRTPMRIASERSDQERKRCSILTSKPAASAEAGAAATCTSMSDRAGATSPSTSGSEGSKPSDTSAATAAS